MNFHKMISLMSKYIMYSSRYLFSKLHSTDLDNDGTIAPLYILIPQLMASFTLQSMGLF